VRVAALVAVLLLTFAADARTLRWRALDVHAKIEASDELSIRERHTMVFDGDWNGGERTFRSVPGQEFVFRGISRVDPATGAKRALSENSPPSRVDEYAWAGPGQLRWRVRLASDPPLRNRELVYEIEYALRYVLLQDGDVYRLDHDFAFANRDSNIEQVNVALELDPIWSVVPDGTSLTFTRQNVPPGETVRGQFAFRYGAEGVPQHVTFPGSQAARAAQIEETPAAPAAPPLPPRSLNDWLVNLSVFAVFLVVSRIALNRFIARERSAGRYEAVEAGRAWLTQHILSQRPEVVGAAWDNTTGEAEVSALIAVMTMEGKLSQTRESGEPVLRLLVDRGTLSEYERRFVEKLFIAGDRITPSKLKLHYSKTGFNPSATLKVPLAREAERLVGRRPLLFACLTGIIGLVVAFNILPAVGIAANDPLASFVGTVGALALAATVIIASMYRSRLHREKGARAIAIPATLFAFLAILARSPFVAGIFTIAALVYVAIALRIARWTGTPEQLRNYMNFRRAREYFADLLKRRERIEDAWVPYILALGLGTELDRWSVAAPHVSTVGAVMPRGSHGSSDASPGTSGSPFGGGGGAFGGGGATGGWAKGISSFAAGISAPSSSGGRSSSGFSSGGSSGGGGSSSSGGGGGGGW
jgi:hypothetical protein